jgi:hypothetical protein
LNNNSPSAKLDRLNNAITIIEGILAHTKAKCMGDYLTLVEAETQSLWYFIPITDIES